MPKRKRIDDKLEWIETLHYPSYRQNRGKYIALLGIGGNIGDTVGDLSISFTIFKVVEISKLLRLRLY